MNDLLIGLAVLVSVSALFGLGWYLGRRTEIQRQVDDAFRRETRLRYSAASPTGRFRAFEPPAPWPMQGLAVREAMAGAQALRDAARASGAPAPRGTLWPEKTLSGAHRRPE